MISNCYQKGKYGSCIYKYEDTYQQDISVLSHK